jgi:hypothetical protein
MPHCKNCNTELAFTDTDRQIYEKVKVPEPTHCYNCRQQRRIAFRNDSNYYRNTCHLCEKGVVSIYSPDKPVPVLCPECFWSDKWDPLSYGQDFDFNRPFFEQYAHMRAKVPRLAIFNTQSTNSEFTVHSSKNHNSYMGSSLVDCEDVMYADWAFSCRDSMDLLFCSRMEMSYHCEDSQDCFHANYLELCTNVSESYIAFDCRGAKRLVGCVSLRNRKNHILNKPASKEECIATIHRLKTDHAFFQDFMSKYKALKASLPKRDAWTTNAENCTGNYIVDSKNAHYAYNIKDVEDARFIYEAKDVQDGYDSCRVGTGEMIYEVKGAVDLKFSKFCNLVYQSDNAVYSDNCQNSSYIFGCMSLKGHKYCFLNKQYTKDEYYELIPKVVEHMKETGEYGEFFPVELSAFGYNETKAQEFFPLTRDEVLAKGWNWSDYEAPLPEGLKTIPASRIPGDIKDVPDDILNWAIVCEGSGKPFKIVKKELQFYRLKGLPIPHRSPKQRHLDRVTLQNPRKLYERDCEHCKHKIRTTYAPDRPEKIYCEPCYLDEVY